MTNTRSTHRTLDESAGSTSRPSLGGGGGGGGGSGGGGGGGGAGLFLPPVGSPEEDSDDDRSASGAGAAAAAAAKASLPPWPGRYNGRAYDVYSLGMVIWECWFQRIPALSCPPAEARAWGEKLAAGSQQQQHVRGGGGGGDGNGLSGSRNGSRNGSGSRLDSSPPAAAAAAPTAPAPAAAAAAAATPLTFPRKAMAVLGEDAGGGAGAAGGGDLRQELRGGAPRALSVEDTAIVASARWKLEEGIITQVLQAQRATGSTAAPKLVAC